MKRDYTSINWDEWFVYDENAYPSCLRWKVDRRGGRGKGVLRVKAGDVAGSVNIDHKKGYSQCNVTLSCKDYIVARVIWTMHNGQIPDGFVVDHIDGNTLNNRLSNLRIVQHCVNGRNMKFNKNNTSGVRGVSFMKVETKLKSRSIYNTYVVVTWTEEGKSQQKTFSVIQLGLLPAFAEAVKYRDYKIQQLNSQGYGYTDRHLQKENNYD